MKWENSRDFGPLLIVRDRLIQLDDMISVKKFFFDDMIESSTWEEDEMQYHIDGWGKKNTTFAPNQL